MGPTVLGHAEAMSLRTRDQVQQLAGYEQLDSAILSGELHLWRLICAA